MELQRSTLIWIFSEITRGIILWGTVFSYQGPKIDGDIHLAVTELTPRMEVEVISGNFHGLSPNTVEETKNNNPLKALKERALVVFLSNQKRDLGDSSSGHAKDVILANEITPAPTIHYHKHYA